MDGDHESRTRTFHNYDQAQSSPVSVSQKLEHEAGAAHLASRVSKGKELYETFMKTLLDFHKKRSTPIMQQPTIDGRPVNLYMLYGYVLKVRPRENCLYSSLTWCRVEAATL